jgi:hypothetical protein
MLMWEMATMLKKLFVLEWVTIPRNSLYTGHSQAAQFKVFATFEDS